MLNMIQNPLQDLESLALYVVYSYTYLFRFTVAIIVNDFLQTK